MLGLGLLFALLVILILAVYLIYSRSGYSRWLSLAHGFLIGPLLFIVIFGIYFHLAESPP
jgi:cell division protein FtsW (lipid II flippase)